MPSRWPCRFDPGQRPADPPGVLRRHLTGLSTPRSSNSHIDYVIEVTRWVAERATSLLGMRIVEEPRMLRHFTASFTPMETT